MIMGYGAVHFKIYNGVICAISDELEYHVFFFEGGGHN